VATDTAVVFDHPVDALAEASADAALVVVGSHRSSRMVGFVTGSIAQHLPAIVHCPVALVPLDAPA
jgi:nucleotide-binding universal stress UspA family protein